MEPSAKDLNLVLDVARELASIGDAQELRARVLPSLRRLVAYDTASFNEVAPDAREAVVAAVEPADMLFEGAEEVFAAYAHQNPLIRVAQLGDAGVQKLSDHIGRRQLHALDIYDLVYADIGVEHQIAFTLPAPSRRVIGFALNRGRGDFSERDRRVLQAVSPFVTAAYRNVAALAGARAALVALESGADADSAGVIVLDAGGRIEAATARAAAWLRQVARRELCTRLPEPLASWCAVQRLRGRRGAAGLDSLRLRASGTCVTAQFLPAAADGLDAIVLRASRAHIEGGAARARLSARESEVLAQVAQGLTNAQIAVALACSERTVAKHLERVYAKLGVHNRTAAALRAHETRAE